jgi:hypothetical protein
MLVVPKNGCTGVLVVENCEAGVVRIIRSSDGMQRVFIVEARGVPRGVGSEDDMRVEVELGVGRSPHVHVG